MSNLVPASFGYNTLTLIMCAPSLWSMSNTRASAPTIDCTRGIGFQSTGEHKRADSPSVEGVPLIAACAKPFVTLAGRPAGTAARVSAKFVSVTVSSNEAQHILI